MPAYGFNNRDIERIRQSVLSTERKSGGPQKNSKRSYPVFPIIVLFKVTSSAAGGGKYNGKIVSVGSSTGADGNLSEGDFGTIGSTENILAFNVREIGKSTHDLSNIGYLPLLFLGLVIGSTSDQKTIVAFDGNQWEDCPV